ncbi:MAG: tryptophan synthase subunit alpha [Planctomycetota bacterium]|jgi:tryptophan synthase alpha chain
MSSQRIHDLFERLRRAGRKALIPYFMGGWPGPDAFVRLLLVAQEAGADLLEVGIPFSDPLADGPVLQRAGQEALRDGVTPLGILDLLRREGRNLRVPVVLMSYVNPVLRIGPSAFFTAAADAGVSGMILPDLPVEEDRGIRAAAEAEGLALISMLSPNASPERIERVTREAEAFLYLVSVTGVTGERPELRFDLGGVLERVRECSGLPVCIGFGVSTPDQAAKTAALANGVITGSAVLRTIRENIDDPVASVGSFLEAMRRAMDAVPCVVGGDASRPDYQAL